MPHIMNIAVAGFPGAGKTSFINTISQQNLEQFGNLLLEVDEVEINFEEICLEEKPREHWDVIFEAKTGVIIVVDSNNQDLLPHLSGIIPLPVPFIIAANKLDSPDVQVTIEQTLHHPVLPCNAKDEDSVKACLTALANTILEQM